MKKIISIILSMIFSISLFVVTVYSSNTDTAEKPELKISDGEFSVINDKTLYKSDDPVIVNDLALDNDRVITIYNGYFFSLADQPLDSIIAEANKLKTVYYALLSEDKDDILLKKTIINEKLSMSSSTLDGSKKYIQDIENMKKTENILGKERNILSVHCFDGSSSHKGISVYVNTDSGLFVRYYDTKSSDGIWFSEKDYAEYAIAYYEYITSYENNYDENGNPLYGQKSFLTFVNENKDITESKFPLKTALLIAIPSAVVLAAVIFFILVLRKKQAAK